MNTNIVVTDQQAEFVNSILGGKYTLFYDRYNSKIHEGKKELCFHITCPYLYFYMDLIYIVPEEYQKGMLYESFWNMEKYKLTCSPFVKLYLKESWMKKVNSDYSCEPMKDFLIPFFAIYGEEISEEMEKYIMNSYYTENLLAEKDYDYVQRTFYSIAEDYALKQGFIKTTSFNDFFKEAVRDMIIEKKARAKILKFLKFVIDEPNFNDATDFSYNQKEWLYPNNVVGAIMLDPDYRL